MKAWLEVRFSTDQSARETIAVGVTAAAVFGFAMVLAGLWLGG